MRRYLLNGRQPVLCESLRDWCAGFDSLERVVARDELVLPEMGSVVVLTVFVGFDETEASPPLLFRTTVRGDVKALTASWDDALAVHASVCDDLKGRV